MGKNVVNHNFRLVLVSSLIALSVPLIIFWGLSPQAKEIAAWQQTIVDVCIMVLGTVLGSFWMRTHSSASFAELERQLERKETKLKLHTKNSCRILFRLRNCFTHFWHLSQNASDIRDLNIQPSPSPRLEAHEKVAQQISGQCYQWVRNIQDSINSWEDIAPEELAEVHKEMDKEGERSWPTQ